MTRLLTTLLSVALLTPSFAGDAPEEINFVGYNLKNYLKMDRRVKGEFKRQADKPEEEVAALIEMIKATDPDILGVVEIGTKLDLADLQTRLKEAGVDLPHSTWCKGADAFRHSALLSRFPITVTNHRSELTYTLQGHLAAQSRHPRRDCPGHRRLRPAHPRPPLEVEAQGQGG